MPNEPRWLTLEELIAFNVIAVEDTGETHFLRDEGLLSMACHNPQNLFYYDGEDDLIVLAVRLMLAIARNHAFEQGNKRTGFIALRAFLEANGYRYIGPDSIELAEEIIAMIEGEMDEDAFVTLIDHCVEEMY